MEASLTPLPRSPEKKAGRVRRAQRQTQVLSMLLGGATEEEIAETLGMRRDTVVTTIRRYLKRAAEEDRAKVEHVRELQLRRIDRLVRAAWPDAVGVNTDGTRKPVSLKAVAEIRNLEALRARIAGTEAPKKVEVSGDIGIALSAEEAQRLESAWAASGGDVIESSAIELPAGESFGP